MAITPWSWAASNGTASTAQTQAAYTAITIKGLTASFRRNVWNDLVSKVNEVAVAVRQAGWIPAYGNLTVSGTKMYRAYEDLTADRFNTLRCNAAYPAWSWENDPSREGYLGRLDFRGAAAYGELGSDIVYGSYFIELTERLNQVIAILNGTGSFYNLTVSTPLIMSSQPKLHKGHAVKPIARQPILLSLHATPYLDKQNTWTLRHLIHGPKAYALLELEEYADYEAMATAMLSIVRKIRVDKSRIGTSAWGGALSAVPLLLTVPPEIISGMARYLLVPDSTAHSFPAISAEAAPLIAQAAAAESVTVPPFPIPWFPWSALQESCAKANTDLVVFFRAAGFGRHFLSGTLVQALPQYTAASATQAHQVAAHLAYTDQFRKMNVGAYAETSFTALPENLTTVERLTAAAESRVRSNAVPTLKCFAPLRARTTATASFYAWLQTDSVWEYPLHIGKDLSFTQVYEVLANRQFAFFDAPRPREPAEASMAFHGEIHGLCSRPLLLGGVVALHAVPTMHATQTDAWELPLQTAAALYIPQAEHYKLRKHRLEVK